MIINFLIIIQEIMNKKETKEQKKIRLLREEIKKISSENEKLKKENIELNNRINNLTNVYNSESTQKLQEYEDRMNSEIEELKRLKSLYQEVIKKHKAIVLKEKTKYKKATNKAITVFNKSLS